MGCSSSTQHHASTPATRLIQYQKESQSYLKDLRLQPNNLDPENYRDGYISVNQFYNHFHNGFCAPYIANPNYMLIIDFRTWDEYSHSHIHTAFHHKEFRWDSSTIEDLRKYSLIVFYDHDGTSAANLHSSCNLAFRILTTSQIDVSCILGGMQLVCQRFPHLISLAKKPPKTSTNSNSTKNKFRRLSLSSTFSISSLSSLSECGTESTVSVDRAHHNFEQKRSSPASNWSKSIPDIPWMPTLVLGNNIFLGRREQADDPRAIQSLGITDVVSIGRSPEQKFKNVRYLGLDGERNLYVTFLAACEFIQTSIEKGGRVLVHGIDGLNRSAAVILAYAMSSVVCTMEEAVFYLQVLRPHLHLDQESVLSLLRWERSIFGHQLTDVAELWL